MDENVRIFLEPSGHRWGNLGDLMMFEVAMARLRSFWPYASITVHTLEPEMLHRLDAGARPLEPWGARAWFGRDALHSIRRRFPNAMTRIARTALVAKGHDRRLADDYLRAVRSADLVIVTGAGSLNDFFLRNALVVLETLELAGASGAVTALMGQGLGPMNDRSLRRRAAAVLPRTDLIALREGVAGIPLLASLGIAADRIRVTGDDAIARAYPAKPQMLGTALGVNVRVAEYASLGADLLHRIGAVIREASQRHATPIVAVPTSRNATEDDAETLRRMMTDAQGANIVTPAALLQQLGRCRVVVAGSYHAALLALSMGIPAVTIASSQYYIDKFRGLAGQFGSACRVVVASEEDFDTRLRRAIDEAWDSADETRAELLAAAARQIALAEDAYRHLMTLVESRRNERRRA